MKSLLFSILLSLSQAPFILNCKNYSILLLPLILDWLLNMWESKKQILSFEIGLFSLQNSDYGQNLIFQSRDLDFCSTSDCLIIIYKIINIVYWRTCSVIPGNLRISIPEIFGYELIPKPSFFLKLRKVSELFSMIRNSLIIPDSRS